MNDFGHHHARRLALCLTLILCGLTGVVLVVADEMRHTVILPPPPTLFALIPLAAVTVATLALPATGGGAPAAWGPAVRWLQVDALAVLAMAPFLAWQARLPANLYVSVVAAMAVGLAAVYLFRLCGLLAMLFAAAGDRAAVGWTRLARILMLYGNLTVVITVGLLRLGE